MHQIFRDDGAMVAAALNNLIAPGSLRVTSIEEVSGDVTSLPLERRIDTVLVGTLDEVPCVLAIECQKEPDPDKHESWPYYVGYLLAKYSRPVSLIVVATSVRTAGWARKPIEVKIPQLGTTMVVRATVLGPDNNPLVKDVDQARANVPQAVFAALVNSGSPEAAGILEVLAEALNSVEVKVAKTYAEFLAAGLINPEVQRRWKVIMAKQAFAYQSELRTEWMDEGRTEGRTEGEAIALIRVMQARGVELSEQARARIRGCRDQAQLLEWLDRAATAASEAELLA
jgi:hypothetical protein